MNDAKAQGAPDHPLLAQAAADTDGLPCMLMCLSADGVLLEANRPFNEFVGLGDTPHEGWVWSALLTPASNEALMQALPQRQDFTLSLHLKDAAAWPAGAWLDGKARWVASRSHYVCELHDVTARVQSERQAVMHAKQLTLIADHVPEMMAFFDASTMQCRFANRGYAELFGWNERAIVGRTVFEIIGEASARDIKPHIDEMLKSKRPTGYTRAMTQRGGEPRWLRVQLLPQLDANNEVLSALALITDITQQRGADQAVMESQERLAKFMQASAEGIVFLSDGLIIDANPAVCALVGRTLEELLGQHTLDFVAPDEQAKVADMIRHNRDALYESALVHKDGRRIPVEVIGRSMLHKGERIRMTIVRDLTEHYRAQEQIRSLALHDALTGLPNRVSLMDDLGHLIAEARRSELQFALLFIDLDHFKRVNDSLGHLVGDTLLQIIARRIRDVLRTSDRVVRFGGDEFIVLAPKLLQREDAEEVAKKLLAAIEVPVNADGRLISVTPSIGISLFPHDAGTADALIKNADTAMYIAKSSGRANYKFFRSSMAHSAFEALVMESQLTQGLARGEFVLHFQPQLRSADSRLVGAEALVRWNHPERGLLTPDAFIELAEQQRLMLPLGQWVLREAMRCAKRWQHSGLRNVPVAVNLSSMQFQASDFTALVHQMLKEEGIPGCMLELELTERMLMDDLGEVMRKLSELKAMGIRISVDDFGTGYSSLAHLKELPIDKMKIDKSFVHDLPGNSDSVAIAHAIVQMARGLNLTVIAEGVETQAQRTFLTSLGVHELQGMLISAPLAAAAFEQWAQGNTGPTP